MTRRHAQAAAGPISLKRAIYAALHEAGNRGLSSADLIVAVYGDSPRPRTAGESVRSSVHRLNADLARVGQRVVSDGHRHLTRWRLTWIRPERAMPRVERRFMPSRHHAGTPERAGR